MSGEQESQTPRDVSKLHLWQIQWVRDSFLILAVIAGVWIGYVMRDITVPLLVALLLAYLFEPLISFLEHHQKFPLGRIPTIVGILTIVTTFVLIVLVLTVPMVISQTSSLVGDVTNGKLRSQLEHVTEKYAPEDLRADIEQTLAYLPSAEKDANIDDSQADVVQTQSENEALMNIAKQTSDVALNVLGGIVRFGMLAVLIPFYFFFFSLWFPDVVKFARSLVPDDGREELESLLAKMDAAVAGFVRGRIVIAIIMGAVLAAGWMIVGVPYAILLGIAIGFLCAVPFLGLIGIPVSVGLLFLDQLGVPEASRMTWWGILLWPTLVFGIVQALDGWILTPLIAGKATNLDPVTIFVAVLAGGSVLGAYGMLLAVPVAACIKISLQEIVLPNIRAWAQGDAKDPLPFEE
ncbi:MAG: AI-2E family transporter [Phycisphaerales bacterium]|jgi:predicted PurR-regulated permease PerM|nr:AI-2E family transporter [Phycisphaerales bacterium]